MKELEELGYVGNGKVTAGKTFAVGVISGDARVVEEYEDDYYIHIYSKPTFTAEDVYSSMFAVSSYTKNLSRSMQIVTYLNTNEEFRTLLQYGVEDIHWEYEDESKDTIRILNKDYSMNLYETGNVYMTYPGEGQTIESWSYGKQQNLDSIYLNFPAAVTSNNKATVNELDPISAKYKKTFDSLTLDQYKEMVTRFERELASNETVSKLLDASDGNSFVGIYDKWYKNNNPTK